MRISGSCRPAPLLAAAAALALLLTGDLPAAEIANPRVLLWDTVTKLGDRLDAADRTRWKAVPTDLLSLEKDPPKASSDPGYYGREYTFEGDAVVENPHLTAVFWTARNRVVIFAKDAPGLPTPSKSTGPFEGFAAVECLALSAPTAPSSSSATTTTTASLELIRNAADEVALGFLPGNLLKTPPSAGEPPAPDLFLFDRSGMVEIRPAKSRPNLRLVAPIEHGIVPGFIGDDLVYSGVPAGQNTPLHLPSENVFVGLLTGGNHELVVTWPNGPHDLRLEPASGPVRSRGFQSLDLNTAGQPVYLAALAAPGLWHRHPLVATNLEADVALPWKRPFPARWKTQLLEAGVKTTFTFRDARTQIWRGVPGSYSYPVWFEGDTAVVHPSKKVPPKGDVLVYCLEGEGSPPAFTPPAEIVKATLGRALADERLDPTGRRLRTHHRRGGEGVRRACTCGCTEAIQALFEAGQEVDRKDDIRSALDDMIYFVGQHLDRIGEYQNFAGRLIQRLDEASKDVPELKTYLDGLKEIATRIPQECTLQQENMKSPEHADDLARRTLALTSRKDPGNIKAYMELLKAWRDMGGAQDYVVAQCHVVARQLHQEAGYAAADHPKAASLAREIRQLCRQILRNPDGYEIWAEY